MGREVRRTITQPAAIGALAHPVRLELMAYLMANGPATASRCARAVGDTPSNCSYHLRALAKVGLVAADESADARERPWRALVTGFDVPDDAMFAALTIQRDQRLVLEHLAGRERMPARWRDADRFGTYTLRLSPGELQDLGERIDALIRPYVASTRDDAPADAGLVHAGFHVFPTEKPHDSGAAAAA
jgi:DNA-binding transcriptional ArsR family regulator